MENNKTYQFFEKTYLVSEVLNFVNPNTNEKKEYDEFKININSLRLQTFKEKGCSCISCGRKGTHFRLQRPKRVKNENYHFGLWSDDNIQMTKDHIIPKSKGGLDHIDNMQTMCSICNELKSNSYTKEDVKNGKAIDRSLLNENGSDIELPRTELSILRKKYPKLKEYKTKINLISKTENPYLITDLNEENNYMISYVKDFYYAVICLSNGEIGLKNKHLRGIPNKIRKELKEKFIKEGLKC